MVYLTGHPVEALNAWMAAAMIDNGSVFRGIGRWGTVSRRAIDPQTVNAIIKQRAVMAGLDPTEISAHGLRSGYLTEAANRGIPLPEPMEQSRHKSVQQASSYYNNSHTPQRPRGKNVVCILKILTQEGRYPCRSLALGAAISQLQDR